MFNGRCIITLNNNSATFREKIPVRLNIYTYIYIYRPIELAIYPSANFFLNSRENNYAMRKDARREEGLKLGVDNGGDV